jgi:hypothetical protein
MAAPFVTGTVAIMMQAAGRPLSIAEVRRLLIGTADPPPGLSGRSSVSLGYGYLNTVAAVEAARQLGRRGSPEEFSTAAYETFSEVSTGWMPRWVPDSQPFKNDAMQVDAMDSADIPIVEAKFHNDNDLYTTDEAYDNQVRSDISHQEEEEEEAHRLTKLYNTLGELKERDLL